MRVVTAILMSGLIVACGEAGTQPVTTAGTLTARLVSPHGAEGAVLIEVRGPASNLEPLSGELHAAATVEGQRVLLLLDPPAPVAFRLQVPDVGSPPEIEILEVAGPDDRIRPALEGYTVEVTR